MDKIEYQKAMHKVADFIERAAIHAFSDSVRRPIREHIESAIGAFSSIDVHYRLAFGVEAWLSVRLSLDVDDKGNPGLKPEVSMNMTSSHRTAFEAAAAVALMSQVTDLAVMIQVYLNDLDIEHPGLIKHKKKS